MRQTTAPLALLSLCLMACSPDISASFTPRTAAGTTATSATPAAKQFYEGDVKALVVAGGEPAGTVKLSESMMWTFASASKEELDEAASKEAAKHGATHYLRLGVGRTDTGYTSVATRFGDTVVVNTRKNGTSFTAYYLIRVPPERWEELPEALRPASKGKPAKTSKAAE